jgi:hypothetical protein
MIRPEQPMTTAVDERTDKKMSDKDRADILAALAKSAYERFDRLADVSWS